MTRYQPINHELVNTVELHIAALKKQRYVQRNGKRTGWSRLPKGCKTGWYKVRAFCRGRAADGQLGTAEDEFRGERDRYTGLLQTPEYARYAGQVSYATSVIAFCDAALPAVEALKKVKQIKIREK